MPLWLLIGNERVAILNNLNGGGKKLHKDLQHNA